MDALWGACAGGGGLANQVEAPVAAEAQGTAQLRAGQAVYRAVHGRVRNTAVRRCKTYKYKHSQKSKTHPSVKPPAPVRILLFFDSSSCLLEIADINAAKSRGLIKKDAWY